MKTPTKGDIVTPKKHITLKGTIASVVHRTTVFNQYKVIRSDKDVFFIIDDWGIERMCYASDWEMYQRAPIFARICNFVNKLFQI